VTPTFVREVLGKKGGFGRFTPLPVPREELMDRLESGGPIPYAEFVTLLLDRYGATRGKPLVGNKTPELARGLRTLHMLWPRLKIVHLIRDGRDVCLSATNWKREAAKFASRFPTWSADPVSTAALWWESYVQPACEDGRALGAEVYYEVRYESLVVQPEEECAALCAFLGIPYRDAMVRYYEGRVNPDPSLDAKDAWLPPTPGLRDWRKQMPARDVERFEAIAGDLLDYLGYPRGAGQPRAEALEHAARIRSEMDGLLVSYHAGRNGHVPQVQPVSA
jgi:hypothetical protein